MITHLSHMSQGFVTKYQGNTTACFAVYEVNSVSDQLPPGWRKSDMASHYNAQGNAIYRLKNTPTQVCLTCRLTLRVRRMSHAGGSVVHEQNRDHED